MASEEDVFSDQTPLRVEEEEEVEEEEGDKEEEEEEDGRIFNTWMQRYRGGSQNKTREEEEEKEGEEKEGGEVGGRAESQLDPPVRRRTDRRASLPCPATLSSMQLSHLHSSTRPPVTARVLLHRSSSRRLLQEAAAPERRPSLIPTIPEVTPPERRSQFRRRNVMSLSDAYSVCLICHHDLSRGAGGTRELECSHTFHRECIEERLWRKHSCPTCHVQVSVPQPDYWSSTRVRVP
ncbi:protein OS-9-like isoform X3 [Cebidichthys violaceus]|uniref:protein OS-9-like isoform X3 n=1 Tax=Cebidichthys violaceus TaxID=271503 RepID=UPI0035CBBF76